MKILHLCLACFYIDNYTYQENILPRINHEDGHDVRILASTETYVDNAHLGYVEPAEYFTEYGVPIKRLPYVKAGNGFVTHKFRAYPHLYEEIAAFAPDVILSHDLSYWSVLDVIRYKKAHPQVKLYADTHADYYTSGTNWLSLHILHRVFYRRLVRLALPALTTLMDVDPRVTYLGWKSGADLQEYLCAAYLYCQPGKVSAIMQNAVCCRCPVMLYPHPDYKEGYDYGNILWEKDEADMSRVFRQLAAGEIDLAALRRGSVRCAEELLDYRTLAARLYR